MNFSTIPTAAASLRPLRLAMTVMTINAICINPSCTATGTPIFKICPIAADCGRKSSRRSEMPIFLLKITANAAATLTV